MRFRFQLVHVCLAAGFALAMAAIVVITVLGAHRQNQQYLATQDIIAKAEIADVYTYLRGQVRQMVYWQDAFDHTVANWDEKWVTYQFGAYQDTMGNHRTAILAADGSVKFLHAPARETTLSRKAFQHAKGLDSLLRKAFKSGVRQPPPMIEGIIVSGGKPYFAIASLMTPEEKSDLAAANRTPFVAIFLSPIETADFDEFQAGFSASDLHTTLTPTYSADERNFALTDADGVPVAWLQWTPHLPGDEFTHQIILPLVIVLAIFMLIQLVVVSRWLKLQRAVLHTQAEVRTVNEQSRLKSVFLGTISHELRTPLNAIIGYSDMLCCQIFGPLGSPRNAEYVHDIRTSGRQLLKIVNDLIEIARIEGRDTCGDEEAFDAAHAARQAINTLQQRIQEKSLRVALVHSEQPAVCRGSQISLTQAIERILSNAIRFSPPGAGIAIKLKNNGRKVTIEIADHGEGIAPDRLRDLQRPFGHPDNHLVAGKGFGFGIPIAKGLIELMHGSFTIESTPGTGTTVRMTLPAETTKPAATPTASDESVVVARRAGGSR